MSSKYTIQWALQFHTNPAYGEVRQLIGKRTALIEPKCGCYAVKLKNKVINRRQIGEIEDRIDILTGET